MSLPDHVSRRGRPKSSSLPDLIREGKLKKCPFKCNYCYRNFPRNKSLMAHLRIHTGEAPYLCTYPECSRPFFKQSGQLKIHQRRHTGEQPFVCPENGCTQRFAHSSRQCPHHPGLKLKKDGLEKVYYHENLSEEQLKWLQEYEENKNRPPKRRKLSENVEKRKYKSVCGIQSDAIHEDETSSSGISTDNGYSGSSPSANSTDNSFSVDDSFEEFEQNVPISNEPQQNCLGTEQFNYGNFSIDYKTYEAAMTLCSFTKQFYLATVQN